MKGNILTSQELIRSMQAKVAAKEADLTNILTPAELVAVKDETAKLPDNFPFSKVVEILETEEMFDERKMDELEIAKIKFGIKPT